MIAPALFSNLRNELTYEISYRERVYPDLIARHRIDSARARSRVQILRDIVALLDDLGPAEVNQRLDAIRRVRAEQTAPQTAQ